LLEIGITYPYEEPPVGGVVIGLVVRADKEKEPEEEFKKAP
jgi:hypothetical protein